MVRADEIENAGETDGWNWIWIKAKSKNCKLDVLIINWGFAHFSVTDKVVVIEQQTEAIVLELHFWDK